MYNKIGIGKHAIATKPNNEFRQPNPRLLYIARPARGRKALIKARQTVPAVIAEAAYSVNAPIRYTCTGNYCGVSISSPPSKSRT